MGAGALTVTTPTAREIVLTRAFDAPRHLVFDAWTKPELLTRWFGARGWNLVVCEVDLRIGGAWRFVSRGPEGERMAQGGTYRVILRPDRLVYTELFDDQSHPGESLGAPVADQLELGARRRTMNWTLEVVVVPVSDVDRAKAFYAEQLGFTVDHDTAVNETTRFVQLTPPGSGCLALTECCGSSCR